jgi:cysteine desulfurase family protein (TIGR01976 family)
VQLGGAYTASVRAGERFYAALEDLAELIQAPSSRHLVFGSSTSLLLRLLAQGLGQRWQAGDEVIVTCCDHEANISPWLDLQAQGIGVKFWPVDSQSFSLRLEDLEPLITDHTRLIAFIHASNVLGTINPLPDIVKFAHDRGIQVCVDGVAYAPHRQLYLQDWDVDFYVFNFYKIFGLRQGVLFGKPELLEELPRLNHTFIDTVPDKLQPGGIPYDITYGNVGICDYLEELGSQIGGVGQTLAQSVHGCFDVIAEYEADLCQRFLDFCQNTPRIQLLGIPEADLNRRVSTCAFSIVDQSPSKIVEALASRDFGIRHGHFYAKRLLQTLRVESPEGVLRISLVHYNTVEEIENLIEALRPFVE